MQSTQRRPSFLSRFRRVSPQRSMIRRPSRFSPSSVRRLLVSRRVPVVRRYYITLKPFYIRRHPRSFRQRINPFGRRPLGQHQYVDTMMRTVDQLGIFSMQTNRPPPFAVPISSPSAWNGIRNLAFRGALKRTRNNLGNVVYSWNPRFARQLSRL